MIHPPKDARGRERRPYGHTSVGVERSKSMITTLLREYGAEGVAWTDNFQTGQVNLRFFVQDAEGRATAFSVTPAPFKEEHTTYNAVLGRNEAVEAPNWPRAMRLLHAWLKSKLEAIAFGLTEVEEEFLAQMVVRDRTGQETTAGELIIPAIAAGGGQLPLALGAPDRKDRGGVVDADARVVD